MEYCGTEVLYIHPREVEDGMVHLAYFDKERCVSFVWSGRMDHPIEVCPGGYAEPVVALIPSPNAPGLSLSGALAYLKAVSDAWLTMNPETPVLPDSRVESWATPGLPRLPQGMNQDEQ